MQPGKPQGAGRWRDGTPVLALPGNPVSVAVSVELFVRPVLRRLQGLAEVLRPTEIARASGWNSPAARRQYIPVTLAVVDGVLEARPSALRGSGSHLIGSLARADGLAIVPEHVTEVAQGDHVEVLRWEREVELLA
jgi:molybdopterin molybdotransferase